MSEPPAGAADAAPHEPAALQARIDALRGVAARLDPVRLRYVEALAARAAAQAGPVRELLWEKLAAAVAECEQRSLAPRVASARTRADGCTPLAELNRQIRGAVGAPDLGRADPVDELPSVRRFRRAWLGSRTQEEVRHAIGRKPPNAGPLNSHMLVLESLAMMSRLSPDYLRRFLVHVRTLQWLDQAGGEDAAPAKPAARPKARATGRAARRK